LTPQLTPEGKIDTLELPADLAEIVSVWSGLPEHIRQTIKTLVSVTVQKDNEVV
jgi:hypothetical protein